MFPQNCFDSILQPQADHHHIFLLPNPIPYKTAFDYFQILLFIYYLLFYYLLLLVIIIIILLLLSLL